MKSVKIVIASLIAIALMVTPIALFATDNTESEAANYQELSDIFDNIDFEKLMELDYSKGSLADDEEVSGSTDVTTYMYLSKNYKFADGASITIKAGASLTMCPTQTFSISSTGWGAINFEAGSHIYITTNGEAPVPDTPIAEGNIIASYDVEDDTPNWFTGSFGYTLKSYEFIFTASNGTTISNSKNPNEQIAKIEFTKDNKTDLKIESASSSGGKSTFDITLKSDLGVKASVFITEKPATAQEKAVIRTIVYEISGTTDYTANAEMQTSTGQNDYKFTLKGSNELNLTLDNDYGGTITDKADFTISATVYEDETKDTVTKMTGSLSLELDTKNMEDYAATPNMTITVKDAKAKYALDFDNDNITGTADMSMGTYKIVAKSETGDVISEMKDVSIYGKYVGKFSFNDISKPTITSGPAQLVSVAPSADYFSGIVPGMSSSEVRSYAAEFFLGSFDKAYHLDQSGLTTTSLDAEVKCGSANINGYTVSGLTASLEIDDSVGLKATGKVDSLIVQPESKTSSSTKFYLGSADFTLATDTSGKSMFTCDFSGSAQMKTYYNGKAVQDLYAKDVKAKMTIGKTNKLTSLSAGEIAMGTSGIYIKATNVNYDTDWEAFLIDKATISGNYYGTAEVKSVEGSLSDVVFYTNMSFSAKSADMRINDVDGDYVQFTRTYDSTTKTITNTYKVTGQVNMNDILDDSTLRGLMNVPISGAVNPKVVNYFEGDAIVAAGSAYELYTVPGVVVADKKINVMSGYSTLIQLNAPSEVYATKAFGMKGAIKVDDVTTTVQLDGAALGLVMNAEGVISYKLIACPGYTLSSTMTYSGMTLSNITESSADVTLTATAVSCDAVPMKYKVTLDGKVVKENVNYGTNVSVENAFPDGDVLYVVDENGAIIGTVDGKDWRFGYYFTKDLDVKSVKGKEVTQFEDAGKVNVINDASSIKFSVPSGQTAMMFQLSSKVRFDLSGLSQDDNVELVAQPTKFDGKDAFIIKVSNSNDLASTAATLYIPFSGEGKRLIHVDEYGRTMELESTVVSIDGDNYLKATVSDYSIFYADSDDSPVIPSKGSSTNWLLIGIGIAAAVIIIAGAVVFIKKR